MSLLIKKISGIWHNRRIERGRMQPRLAHCIELEWKVLKKTVTRLHIADAYK